MIYWLFITRCLTFVLNDLLRLYMAIKFFVSVSVLSSIWTRHIIFQALFELCLFLKKKAKRCPLRPGKTPFSGCPRSSRKSEVGPVSLNIERVYWYVDSCTPVIKAQYRFEFNGQPPTQASKQASKRTWPCTCTAVPCYRRLLHVWDRTLVPRKVRPKDVLAVKIYCRGHFHVRRLR